MGYTFIECPRCQSTIRPADRSADGGQWVCYECGLEFLSDEEPGGSSTRLYDVADSMGACRAPRRDSNSRRAA